MSVPDDGVSLRWSGDEDVAELILDRPSKLNALRCADLDHLQMHLMRLRSGPVRPRVLLVRSSSCRAFSVGADIEEWTRFTPQQAMAAARRGNEVLEALSQSPWASVAVIRGHCLGGGLELALACDLRIAEHGARLGFPEVTLGNSPGWGGLGRLVAMVGDGRARDLLLTGRVLTGDDLFAYGLVSRVVGVEKVERVTGELVEVLLRNAPVAIQAIKEAVAIAGGVARGMSHADVLAAGLTASTADAQRGKRAFFEHEQAHFEGC